MSNTPSASLTKSILLSLLILLAAGGMLVLIFRTEPRAQRSGATKKTPMLVEVVRAEKGSFRPTIQLTGTVRAEKDVALSPQVSGAVVSRSEDFSPGKLVEQDTVLLQIDPSNYRISLAQAKSALAQAKTALRLEVGQQDIAQQEYQALFQRADIELSPEEKELVLRQPQLVAARQTVESAEAAVRQSELNLARATLRAPFDAQVIERQVDVGAHVQPSTTLGRLVGIEMYWVEASVPLAQRRWLVFPKKDDECSEVAIKNRASWPEGSSRKGCLARLIGSLDESTRMARILIEVDDPLGRKGAEDESVPALMIGEFVQVHVEGKPLENVVRVPRDYVRKGNTVWLSREETLRIVEPTVVLQDRNYAYVTEGVQDGDLIVTTDLSRVREGAPLRFESAARSESEARGAARE